MKKIILSFIFCFGLYGCGAAMKAEMENADYGTPPTDYQSKIIDFVKPLLKDPDSAKFTFDSLPRKGQYRYRNYGYVVCAKVNAKNSYGGYTGDQLQYFFFVNDQITASHGVVDNQYPQFIANLCSMR
jgi:hypothetical protein